MKPNKKLLFALLITTCVATSCQGMYRRVAINKIKALIDTARIKSITYGIAGIYRIFPDKINVLREELTNHFIDDGPKTTKIELFYEQMTDFDPETLKNVVDSFLNYLDYLDDSTINIRQAAKLFIDETYQQFCKQSRKDCDI